MSAAMYQEQVTPYYITVMGAGCLLHEVTSPHREFEFFHSLLLAAQQCANWQQLVEGRSMYCQFCGSGTEISLAEELRISLLVPISPSLLQGHDLSTALAEIYGLTGMNMFRGQLILMLGNSGRWWEDSSALYTISLLRDQGIRFGVDLSNITTADAGRLLQWLHEGGLDLLQMVRLPVFLHRAAMKRQCVVKHIIDLVMRSTTCVLNAHGVTCPDDSRYLHQYGVVCMQGDVISYRQSSQQVEAALRSMIDLTTRHPAIDPPTMSAIKKR